MTDDLVTALKAQAAAEGFVACGIAPAAAAPEAADRLGRWLDEGRPGGMIWGETRRGGGDWSDARRGAPRSPRRPVARGQIGDHARNELRAAGRSPDAGRSTRAR